MKYDVLKSIDLQYSIIGNVNNQFMLLSHTQFIENRVYDDDDEEEAISKHNKTGTDGFGENTSNNKSKDPEAAFIHNVTTALKTSFNFIDDSFHQVEVGLQILQF